MELSSVLFTCSCSKLVTTNLPSIGFFKVSTIGPSLSSVLAKLRRVPTANHNTWADELSCPSNRICFDGSRIDLIAVSKKIDVKSIQPPFRVERPQRESDSAKGIVLKQVGFSSVGLAEIRVSHKP